MIFVDFAWWVCFSWCIDTLVVLGFVLIHRFIGWLFVWVFLGWFDWLYDCVCVIWFLVGNLLWSCLFVCLYCCGLILVTLGLLCVIYLFCELDLHFMRFGFCSLWVYYCVRRWRFNCILFCYLMLWMVLVLMCLGGLHWFWLCLLLFMFACW